mgnify:FL=1
MKFQDMPYERIDFAKVQEEMGELIRELDAAKSGEEQFEVHQKYYALTDRVMTLMMPGMMLIMYALTVAIVWVAAKKIDLGVMQVGSMTAFITYAMLIVMAFLMLTMMSIMLPLSLIHI